MIALPEDFISNITGIVSELFSGLAGYVTLLIGIFLGLEVIKAVVEMVRHRFHKTAE